MAEENTDLHTDEGDQKHWSQGHEAITGSEDLAKYAAKFDDVAAAVKSGHELEKKLGSSYRLPDDLGTLNEEQRAELLTKTANLRDVPESPDGYEIQVPDGIERDENFISAFTALAHEKKWSKGDVQAMADFYMDAMRTGNEARAQQAEKDAQQAETDYRIRCGHEYEQRMKEIDITRAQITEKLNLGYRDKDGNMKSKLDDALDMRDENGRALGNSPVILQVLNYVYDNLFKEHEPVVGAGVEPGSVGGGVLSDGFYKNPS